MLDPTEQPKPKLQIVLENLGKLLCQVSLANGYATDFHQISYWEDLPAEYSKNQLTYRDILPDYDRLGLRFEQVGNHEEWKVPIEIEAIVGESPALVVDGPVKQNAAALAGTMALVDLRRVLGLDPSLGGYCKGLSVVRATKDVQTRGKRVCVILLEIVLVFRTSRYGVN